MCRYGTPREFTAANLQAESQLERRNVGSAALGVAHATSGILTRDQLNPYLQGAQGKEVAIRVPITMLGFTKEQYTGIMQML